MLDKLLKGFKGFEKQEKYGSQPVEKYNDMIKRPYITKDGKTIFYDPEGKEPGIHSTNKENYDGESEYVWFGYFNEQGKLHRNEDDGPALKKNGQRCYYKNGVLHRFHGPAIINKNGSTEYFLNGNKINLSPFLNKWVSDIFNSGCMDNEAQILLSTLPGGLLPLLDKLEEKDYSKIFELRKDAGEIIKLIRGE